MTAMKKWLGVLLCAAMLLAACTGFAEDVSLLARAQGVLEALIAGQYEEVAVQFDENMAAAVDAAALESAWHSVTAQFGAVTDVAGAQEDAASRTVALLLAHEAGGTMLVTVFDENGQIAGLAITPQQQAAQTIARSLPEGALARQVTLFAGCERELAGELLIPARSDGDTLYVVLAQGSGPSDMDETVGGCKPLRDLAYDLAALGVGSLRFDKITYAHPEYPVETVEQEYLEPVAEALRVLRQEADVQRVYLIGHSEGGMLAPYLVSECGFDGGVALAGTPLQLWEISYRQNLALLGSVPQEQREALLAQVEAEREKALAIETMTDEAARQASAFGMPGLYLAHMARMDQAQLALESGKPFLFLWGEADFQVDGEAHAAWQVCLGDDARFTYRTYPGLNHLFMPAGEGDSIANAQAAYQQPKLMDARVAADIAAWMMTQ